MSVILVVDSVFPIVRSLAAVSVKVTSDFDVVVIELFTVISPLA